MLGSSAEAESFPPVSFPTRSLMKKVENHWLTHLTSVFLNLWGYLYANRNMCWRLAEFICTCWTFPPESPSHSSAISRAEGSKAIQSWLWRGAVKGHSCPTEKLGTHFSKGEMGKWTIIVNYLASVNTNVCEKVFQPFFPKKFWWLFQVPIINFQTPDIWVPVWNRDC